MSASVSAVLGDSQGKLWLPKREGTRRRWGGFSGLYTLTAENTVNKIIASAYD